MKKRETKSDDAFFAELQSIWDSHSRRVEKIVRESDSRRPLNYRYAESCQQPSPPVPPLVAARRMVGVRLAAVIALLLVVAGFLLLFRGSPAPHDTLQAGLPEPSLPVATPPAAAPVAVPHAVPRHVTVAKAGTDARTPLPATGDTPLSQPAAPADSLCQPCTTISFDNVQYTALYCNNETCDTQNYLYQVFVTLNLA